MDENLYGSYWDERVLSPLAEHLNASDFDELLEIDLIYDRCRNLCHKDGKYFAPVLSGVFSEMFVYSVEHMTHPEDRETLRELMRTDTLLDRLANAEQPGVLRAQLRYRLLDGGWRWVEQIVLGGAEHGFGEGVVRIYIFDLQERTDHQLSESGSGGSNWDEVTGLLRKKAFFSACEQKLQQGGGPWYMLAVDIENFRVFNEWYGHETGDLLLAQIGGILKTEEERSGGVAGYMGQDDFCMLLPRETAEFEQLYAHIHELVQSRGTSVGFLPAFGVSELEPGGSAREAMDRAAIASGQVKGDFRARIQFYDPSLQNQTEQEYRLLSDFQRGLKNHELYFCLQPQCLVPSGKIAGAESLARWTLPDGRPVRPDVFVPVLEKYGFVTDLDKYIWESVCEWLHRWMADGHKAVPISVNVSQTDFFAIDVPEYIEQLTEKYGIDHSLLKIEITESAYVNNAEHVREAVQRLRERGFLILMDDFGSGYSSLNMLREINVDVIKLDAQFLQMSERDEVKGIHILETIVNMTKTMAVPIIIEGVENEEQAQFLETLGCHYIQGYYYYRPMSVAEFERLISHQGSIEDGGLSFFSNQQFSVREFMDENIYSDSMLNNILGAAAFYCWDGEENVDIVRYNEQFFRMVNVPDFLNRLHGIQRYFHPADVPVFFDLLAKAEQDRMNGASGVMGVYRTDGSLGRFYEHFYFLEKGDSGKIFYGAMQDVTEITRLQNQMRLIARFSSESIIFLRRAGGGWRYQVVAHGLRDVLGDEAEEFENKLNAGESLLSREIGERLTELSGQKTGQDGTLWQLHAVDRDGKPLSLYMKSDYVHDDYSDVEYILNLRL